MEFQFTKYTEVTDLAHQVNPSYKESGYTRIFICWDVNSYWLARILAGYNEYYARQEGSFILERNEIPKMKTECLTISKARKILIEDDFDNWDFECSTDVNDLIEMIDGGFGILNLKED